MVQRLTTTLRLLYTTALLCGLVTCAAFAQSDPFGQTDIVSIDSVKAGRGQDVTVSVRLKNDETLGSMSIPLAYDTASLTLKAISFAGSRVDYITNKLTTPSVINQINGHFVVAVIRIQEAAIPAGDGPIFTLQFTVSPNAVVGSTLKIDSLFYAPGGELLLAEAATAQSIRPAFKFGKVVVAGANHPPDFANLADQSVLEGDSLNLRIVATDPDGDHLTLALPSKPLGATFIDSTNGVARFSWMPDFVGPSSSDGSPFALKFWVSDGTAAVQKEISVTVINRNRAPKITAPGNVAIVAGTTAEFNISAVDPDFESINWSLSGCPSGMTFNQKNPGTCTWNTAVTDSGSQTITFVAADPQGFSDTAHVVVRVNATTLYTAQLDTVSAYPNENAPLYLRLNNELKVGGFDFVLQYDPTALNLAGFTNFGTRSESFEYFSVVNNYNGIIGNIHIVGTANLPVAPETPALAAGDGALAKLTFRTTSNLAYAGLNVPVRFGYLDLVGMNTLYDSNNVAIADGDVVYLDGSVKIRSIGNVKLGDINLNGLSNEIGDVIYFTNYFINPQLYGFNSLQYANSDVNRDNIAATISDLIFMINVLVNGGSSPKLSAQDLHAHLNATQTSDQMLLAATADFTVGGAFVSLETDQPITLDDIQNLQPQMTMAAYIEDHKVNLLLYSLTGESIPAGDANLFAVKNVTTSRVQIVDLASADGQYVSVQKPTDNVTLPSEYSLSQNYPNPFNPETQIEFALPTAGRARLTVYNCLGQEVRALVNDDLTAGSHTVRWDGRDNRGDAAASGIYLYRLDATGVSLTRKMALVK